jgi:uncharacterized protein YggE
MTGMDEFITTTGTGSVSTAPDAMRVTITIEAAAPTVAEALAAAADGVARAGEVARRHTTEDRIASQGFRVHPTRDEGGRAEGYTAAHMLRLDCALADAGQLVSDLGAAVGDTLRVHDVQPVVSDARDQVRRARELAFEDARATALQLAGLAGRTLDRTLRVREGFDSGVGRAMPASLGSFEPGTQDVTTSVTVRWALTDRA